MHAPLRSGLAGPLLERCGVYILLGFETSLLFFLKVNGHPGTEELHQVGLVDSPEVARFERTGVLGPLGPRMDQGGEGGLAGLFVG